MTDKKRRSAGKKVDGQPRVIEKDPIRSTKGTKHIYWLIPVIIVFLIVPLLIFHLGSGGGSDTASEEEAATEETADSGEESGGTEEEGGEETASSGDVDAEGIARDNCASCHGQDFSGSMGPALAGTSLDEEEFTSIVREGQGSMPAFSADQVADEELTAMYQFFSEQ